MFERTSAHDELIVNAAEAGSCLWVALADISMDKQDFFYLIQGCIGESFFFPEYCEALIDFINDQELPIQFISIIGSLPLTHQIETDFNGLPTSIGFTNGSRVQVHAVRRAGHAPLPFDPTLDGIPISSKIRSLSDLYPTQASFVNEVTSLSTSEIDAVYTQAVLEEDHENGMQQHDRPVSVMLSSKKRKDDRGLIVKDTLIISDG